MDKERKQIIITSILGVVFIFAAINAIGTIKKRSKPKSKKIIQSHPYDGFKPSQPVNIPQQVVQFNNKKNRNNSSKWVRCPFSGKFYNKTSGVPSLGLIGILWDDNDPQAVINENILSVGDMVGDYIISDIQQNKVILTDGEKSFELKL